LHLKFDDTPEDNLRGNDVELRVIGEKTQNNFKAMYRFGKITSKHLIVEIIRYSTLLYLKTLFKLST